MTRLFVGNLPASATDSSISALFASHGKVESVDLIVDRETGHPRGFGFIVMPAPDAARAIEKLHGQDFEGRTLKVKEAEELPAQGDRKRGNRRRH
jgi:RNA recognition motif-containing protein